MDWWKPIKSGGSLSCDTCPEVRDLREMVDALTQELARAKRHDLGELYNKMGEELTKAVLETKRWREVAERLAEAGTHQTAHALAMDNYFKAVNDGWL